MIDPQTHACVLPYFKAIFFIRKDICMVSMGNNFPIHKVNLHRHRLLLNIALQVGDFSA